MGFIYKVTNTVNGKIYVGQTSRTIEDRWREHVRDAFKRKKQAFFPFHLAIKKYGQDAFQIEQLEECSSHDLDERERYWIKYYDTYHNGYNADYGGRSNKGHPIYQYALDGTFIKGFNTLGDAQEAIGGKAIVLNSKHPNRAIGGYLWNREKVDKLDFVWSPRVKSVHQYSIDGKYIASFDSLRQAAYIVSGRASSCFIGGACRGDYDTAYGYRWSFEKVDKLPPFVPYKAERKVVRFLPDGSDMKIYESLKEAACDTNANVPNIIEACKRQNYKSKGYYWRYYDQLDLAG